MVRGPSGLHAGMGIVQQILHKVSPHSLYDRGGYSCSERLSSSIVVLVKDWQLRIVLENIVLICG